MTDEIHNRRPKFFSTVNYFVKRSKHCHRNFFKNCNVEEGILPSYVKGACEAVGFRGEAYEVILHSMGFKHHASHFFSKQATRNRLCQKTGHSDSHSALTYSNTDDMLGKKLQSDMFGGTFKDELNPSDNNNKN